MIRRFLSLQNAVRDRRNKIQQIQTHLATAGANIPEPHRLQMAQQMDALRNEAAQLDNEIRASVTRIQTEPNLRDIWAQFSRSMAAATAAGNANANPNASVAPAAQAPPQRRQAIAPQPQPLMGAPMDMSTVHAHAREMVARAQGGPAPQPPQAPNAAVEAVRREGAKRAEALKMHLAKLPITEQMLHTVRIPVRFALSSGEQVVVVPLATSILSNGGFETIDKGSYWPAVANQLKLQTPSAPIELQAFARQHLVGLEERWKSTIRKMHQQAAEAQAAQAAQPPPMPQQPPQPQQPRQLGRLTKVGAPSRAPPTGSDVDEAKARFDVMWAEVKQAIPRGASSESDVADLAASKAPTNMVELRPDQQAAVRQTIVGMHPNITAIVGAGPAILHMWGDLQCRRIFDLVRQIASMPC